MKIDENHNRLDLHIEEEFLIALKMIEKDNF